MFSLFPLHFLLAEEKDEEQVVKEEEVVETDVEDEVDWSRRTGKRKRSGRRKTREVESEVQCMTPAHMPIEEYIVSVQV